MSNMSRGATITATPTTPPKTASASEHAENSSKSVSSSYIAASNTQHDQRYKSNADEQHYERDGVVFEPMPITGKHDVSSLFQMDCENRSAVAPRSSGGLLPPSPPAEKATACQDQTWQSCTCYG